MSSPCPTLHWLCPLALIPLSHTISHGPHSTTVLSLYHCLVLIPLMASLSIPVSHMIPARPHEWLVVVMQTSKSDTRCTLNHFAFLAQKINHAKSNPESSLDAGLVVQRVHVYTILLNGKGKESKAGIAIDS
jgi:hypothetical protein